MSQSVFFTIASTGFTVAFFHAAIPTHWLPFVLTSRVQRWSFARLKPKQTHLVRALAAVLALTPFAAFAQSTNDLVRIEVRVQSDSDRKDIKGTSADRVTQSKILNITISGKAKSPETRTGKWTAYGRSMKGNDITVLESGEFKVDLASGAQKIESKKITTTSTPEHSVVSGSTGRGRSPKAKKVAGEGTKFIGYGVQVKDGGKAVGQLFDPAGLEKETK